MYSGRFVFSQVMDHLPMKAFRRCVQRYGGNRHIQSFTCLDKLLCMAFAQLTWSGPLWSTGGMSRSLYWGVTPLLGWKT